VVVAELGDCMGKVREDSVIADTKIRMGDVALGGCSCTVCFN
jgi:hypothetical protein